MEIVGMEVSVLKSWIKKMIACAVIIGMSAIGLDIADRCDLHPIVDVICLIIMGIALVSMFGFTVDDIEKGRRNREQKWHPYGWGDTLSAREIPPQTIVSSRVVIAWRDEDDPAAKRSLSAVRWRAIQLGKDRVRHVLRSCHR